MRRFIGLMLLALVFAVGCSDDDGSGPNATIEGTYTLRTVNGAAVPYVVVQAPGLKVELVSVVWTLQQGGTFTEVATMRFTDETGVNTDVQTTTGTFVRTGNNVTLTETSDGEVSTLMAVWNGDNQLTLTQSDPEIGTFVFVFRK